MLKITNEFVLERLQPLNMVESGIVLVPRSGDVIWSNTKFAQWFPHSLEENVSRRIWDILGSTDFRVRRGQIVNPLSDVNSKGNEDTTPLVSEIRIPDGRYFEISVRPYLDKDLLAEVGEEVYFMAFRDLTQVYNLNDSFMELFIACESLMNLSTRTAASTTNEARLGFLSSGIVSVCRNLLKCEVMETRIYRRKSNSLELFAHYGITEEAIQRDVRLHQTQSGIIGYVASTKKTYRCNDTSKDPYYLVGGKDSKSSLTAPIVFLGNLLGIVNVESSETYAFSDLDVKRIEFFVQYLAISLNTFHLLEEANKSATLMNVEEIHARIAKPSKIIAEAASQLVSLISENDVEANKLLHSILIQIFDVRHIVSAVGRELESPATGKEVTLVSELNKKHVLLVSCDDNLIQCVSNFFYENDSNLCIMQTGKTALSAITAALRANDPHYLIVVDIAKIPDFESRTKFFVELCRLYGETHPPLLMIQKMMCYDGDHVLTNTRCLYPYSQYVGYDSSKHEIPEAMLMHQISKVIKESTEAKLDLNSSVVQNLLAMYSK